MSKNAKGKRGERKFCRLLREHGYGAIRAAQVAGKKNYDDSADVITSLEIVRFEVKHGYNDVNPWSQQFKDWINKLEEETPERKVGVLAWRPNYADWQFFFQTGRGGLVYCRNVPAMENELSRHMGYVNENIIESYRVEDPSSWKTTGTFQ